MSKGLTINEAAIEVLKKYGKPISADTIYQGISQDKLYVFKAKQPKNVLLSQLRRHCINLDFPSASPIKYFLAYPKNLYGLAVWNKQDAHVPSSSSVESLPEETIQKAHKDHIERIRDELRSRILTNNPAFFERLVIKLLIAMGYGGSDPENAFHTGRPGDGGIDGIINEDKLGLEKIYLQAKRYADSRSVHREEIQQFAGAMNTVKKGVFITTSEFSDTARTCAQQHEKQIRLIDGRDLTELMTNYRIGVQIEKTFDILTIDNNFFTTDDLW